MYVKVHATPGAKKEKVDKKDDITYDIFVKEPAERNLANNRIRELLCIEYGLDKGEVKMVSGHRSRSKIFDINHK